LLKITQEEAAQFIFQPQYTLIQPSASWGNHLWPACIKSTKPLTAHDFEVHL